MKHFTYLLTLLTLVLASCGSSSDRFKIEGHLLNLNQGEFFVYSTDGELTGVDTIKVNGGRFSYETECSHASTLVVVFPNFSEQPVFAQPGKKVDMEGDATHLKELTVKGTDDNELMNEFRKNTLQASPPEVRKMVENFVGNHPQSPVGTYLVRRYFMQQPDADFTKAAALLAKLSKEQPNNGSVQMLKKQAESMAKLKMNVAVPKFSAVDTEGRRVSDADLGKGAAVVTVWATWNFDSQNIQRIVHRHKRRMGDRLKVVSICLNASKQECSLDMKRDSVDWPTVCDGRMFESPVLQQLGLGNIPDNLLILNGRVVARGLKPQEIDDRLKKL